MSKHVGFTYSSHLFLQETLDKTVDIDLVLNLKCAESGMSKKDKSTGLYSPLEFLRRTSGINMSLQSEGGHFRPSSTMTDVSRKKLHVHAEQVPIRFPEILQMETLEKF